MHASVRRGGFGAIAQLGERLLCKQEVVGSIPSGSTIFSCLGMNARPMRTSMCLSAVRLRLLCRDELRSLTMWMCFDVYSEQKCSSTTAITRFSTVLIPLALSNRLFVLVSS
jgi:hypothetical protein